MALPWGMFGENLTTEGLSEQETHIGDQFRIGEAIVMVTQPRTPCYKLALKFQRDDMLKRMLTNGRSGFYLAVIQQGVMQSGDSIERTHEDSDRISVAEINTLYRDGGKDANLLKRAANLEALPASWRDYLREELTSLEHAT
jgi:MOSC domain-containing protein YiiM